MRQRKTSSGGQAIVMVTLALLSMSGMMGLAVDLGWSYFTQKAAQAAADNAALSAVQRAFKSIQSSGGTATALTACGSLGVTCAATPVACNPNSSALGNLQSGCLYARNAGFTPGGHSGRQNVLVEANIPSVAFPDSIPTNPGSPRDMVYWVTVRTYENIPQLFSAVLGNQNGAISAVATAAIASKIVPGSFWGMNKIGDCMFSGGSASGGFTYTNCGADINITGKGASCPGSSPSQSAYLCAPAGIVMSSTCAANGLAGCGNKTSNPGATTGNNYAGNSGSVWGGPSIDVVTANAAGGLTAVPTPTVAGAPNDPFVNLPQPPLAAASSSNSAIGSCGYSGGNVPANATLGPLQFYSYTARTVAGKALNIPDAQPLSLSGVTFSPSVAGAAGCPGGVYTAGPNTQGSNSAFPTYILYGGVSSFGGGTITMGAGQYVFAGNNGSNSVPGATGGNDNVIAAKNTTFTDVNNGTTAPVMMILTDGKYPGLSTQMSNIPNWNCTAATCGGTNSLINPAITDPSTGENYLVQGSVQTKNTDWTLSGFDKSTLGQSIPALSPYDGILIWQDQRDSTDIYDSTGHVIACFVGCPNTPTTAQYEANNVTATSPGLSMSDGNGTAVLKGAIYQPRGAWYEINPGTTGVTNSPLQVFTGMLDGGGGNTNFTLIGPSVPVISYLPVLIQ